MLRASGWLAEQHAADQRRFTQLLFASFLAHALAVVGLSIAPTPDAPRLPEVLSVDLVASLPTPGALPRPKAPAPPKPEPKPEPKPVTPPAPPPPPAPKEIVLPKQAPKAIPKQRVAPPPKPAPIDYEDALSQLRNELGEKAPAPVAPQAAQAPPAPAAEPSPDAGQAAIDREIAAWLLDVKRHVERRYITPPEFQRRGFSTGLQIVLTSTGELVGMPSVVRSSGDPFFDDNAVRALMMSAPIPAPPQAGSYTFVFYSEDR